MEKVVKSPIDISEKVVSLHSENFFIMLERKIQKTIVEYLTDKTGKVLIIDGARQVGKSYIIRYEGKRLFKHYVELNMLEDKIGRQVFANLKGTDDFYLRLSSVANTTLGDSSDTLVFIDEIQAYPELLTMLKFLKDENRYSYIVSGSLLGVTLNKTLSKPGGRIVVEHMYPLDFEEFLWANHVGNDVIDFMHTQFAAQQCLNEPLHNRIMELFMNYLLIGGLPDAVNTYLDTHNIQEVRRIHSEIYQLYKEDASQYGKEKKLKIQRIYEMIPSNMENRKKRLYFSQIENKVGKSMRDYEDDIEYLISSGIAVNVQSISNPVFPLMSSAHKNLLKLYMNDVGLLTYVLFRNNVMAVKNDEHSVNLGAVYETVVATELQAHGHPLYYYDNKKKGEVDFLLDNYNELSVLPLEIKSGKDYTTHHALSRFLTNTDYHVKEAYVLSNERMVTHDAQITYLPIYYLMFI